MGGSPDADRRSGPGRDLVARLAALPRLDAIPQGELEWLVDHGSVERHEAGSVIGAKGEPVDHLWVVLSGRVTVRVDRGAGLRDVLTWGAGDVTGLLPYSRMVGTPGDNVLEEASELLRVHRDHFPELTRCCPVFTAYTVHLMLDRARSFNASELRDEKMMSLGRLAAGLAHEVNNPASATVRGARVLQSELVEVERAAREVGEAGLDAGALEVLLSVRDTGMEVSDNDELTPMELADREDEFVGWLERNGCDPSRAIPLAESGLTLSDLDRLRKALPANTLDTVLAWIASASTVHALARDIERAATRIHELVAAVKRFTYMDRQAGAESIDLEIGLRDTIRVLGSKAKEKGVPVSLEIEAGLPRVSAVGGELNQVWMNLIDNALDAVGESGAITVTARREADRVVVRVIDDGIGIEPGDLPRVFDPFFTTKPPGQGTGLGLDIARRLVRGFSGDIRVESRPGRTEFRVSLIPDPGPAKGPEAP